MSIIGASLSCSCLELSLIPVYQSFGIAAELSRMYSHTDVTETLTISQILNLTGFRKALKKSVKSDKALKAAQEELFKSKPFHALVGTTQAIDLINGGVKTNALPELAWAVVNHRIATDRSVLPIVSLATTTTV